MTNQTLPRAFRMTIAEIEGRFYPLRVSERSALEEVRLDIPPQYSWEVEHACGIPFAVGPEPAEGIISFETRSLALEFCSRDVENRGLWFAWEALTTQSELYPERNAWYRDEIARLAQREPKVETNECFAFGFVWLGNALCSSRGSTIDEAWVKLYERVCWAMITAQEVA